KGAALAGANRSSIGAAPRSPMLLSGTEIGLSQVLAAKTRRLRARSTPAAALRHTYVLATSTGRPTLPRLSDALLGFALFLPAFPPAAAQPAAAGAKIVVASKIDTEGALLGNMIVAVLRAHDLPVENKLQLGPTTIVRGAILAGQIDTYPEYTGNGAFFFHREADPVWKDRAKGFAEVARLDRDRNRLIWLTA